MSDLHAGVGFPSIENGRYVHWFSVEVLDKYYKNGFFGRKFYLTFRFKHDNSVHSLRGNETNYYNMEIGTRHQIKMYSDDGQFWTTT